MSQIHHRIPRSRVEPFEWDEERQWCQGRNLDVVAKKKVVVDLLFRIRIRCEWRNVQQSSDFRNLQ